MKSHAKFLVGIISAAVVIGAATLLVIKYFDVLVKVCGDLKKQLFGKRRSYLSEACCSDQDEDDFDED